MSNELRTAFAPPQRAREEELARHRGYFSDAWFFGELMNYVPDMVMILNRYRQIVYANRSTLNAVGAESLDAVVGKRPGELFNCKHARETEGGCGTSEFCRYCGAVNSILDSQNGRFAVEECRITVKQEACEEAMDLRVWSTPMTFCTEPFSFFVILNIAEEKRRFFLERIFLHDLMNTASGLIGLSELLGSEELDPAEREQFTRRINFLSHRIIGEIQSHRQLVAAENNELELNSRVLDSRNVLEEVFAAYNLPDLRNDRLLRLEETSASVQFESDNTLLTRVIANMVKNAIEASAPGELVTMGCREKGGRVAFWVHNLTYMPENIRLQVFNRSFSTKGTGRGLGTYSMKYLTEKYLQGKISFTTTEAEGTTFEAVYPLRLEEKPGKAAKCA